MENSILRLIEKTRRIGTWTVDVSSSTVTWSPTTYAIHEEDPSKTLRLEDGISYYVPEHRPIIEACVANSISDGRPWDVELQIRTAKGQLRWVRAIGEPVFEGDDLQRLQGVFEDIHERKTLEVEREELLQRVMDGERIAKLGHWRWTGTPDALQWTPGTYHLHGIPETQRPPELDEYIATIHPDDRERVRRTKLEAFAAGKRYVVDFRRNREGALKHIRSEGFPQRDASGELIGFAGVAIDRTGEVEAQLRIEELNRRLTLALEAAQIGVWEWRIDSNELIWDPYMYRLYGIAETEFTGTYDAWSNGLHPDDRADVEAKIEMAIASNGTFEATFRVVWADGTVRSLQGAADVICDEGGKPERFIGVNWDITALVDARKELERSNEELAQFAYRSSHDLKSPLTAIRRLTAYMQQDLKEGILDEVEISIAAIEQRASAMEEMVVGILDTAKADLSTTRAESISFEEIIGEIADSLRFLSEDRGVTISWEDGSAVSPQLARMRVYQILSNLVGNGIKYSMSRPERSFVRVSTASRNDRWILTVEDNGKGLPGAGVETPYKMFARFDSEQSGSGLGLYIVKKHVDALGGTIDYVSSEAGTRFELTFPLESSSPVKALA